MKIERFEDIEAWQLARELTRKVYRLTKKPGFARDYGLKKQIQDAAVRGFINYLKKYEERKAINCGKYSPNIGLLDSQTFDLLTIFIN